MDPRRAPTDIRRLHLSDELAYFFINSRSAGDTRGRFTDDLSIASCWRSAKFSSVN